MRTVKKTNLSSLKLSKNIKNSETMDIDEMLTLSVNDIMRANLANNFKVEHNIILNK